MNDHELKHHLDQLRVPLPEEGAKERVWHRAELAFKSGAHEPEEEDARRGFRAFALAIAACAVIAAAFLVGRWSGNPASSAELRLLAEMQRVFPDQLQAIISSGDRTEILTSADATTFSSQPLLVELRERGQRIRIVSFSGQRITARLDGRQMTLEFLVTPDGAVLIAGDKFVWRSDRPHAVDGFEIEARQLTASL